MSGSITSVRSGGVRACRSCVKAHSQMHTPPPRASLQAGHAETLDPASESRWALLAPECQINSPQPTTDGSSLPQNKEIPTNKDSRCSALAFPLYRAVGQELKNHLENKFSAPLHYSTLLLHGCRQQQVINSLCARLPTEEAETIANWSLQVKFLEIY